jgi:uncharacterized protein (TIGR00730 family)
MNDSDVSASQRPFTVCVYCGSRMGARADYAAAASEVGRLIGQSGWGLVYGGGKVGLMGVVADAALTAGAPVTGVIPRTLMEREVGHQRLNHLHVVETMHERKLMMAELADAFLALPGGIGTLEELYEVWTWHQLGYHAKPIGLLNVAGYYDALLGFMNQSVAEGFLDPRQQGIVQTSTEPGPLLKKLYAATQTASGHNAPPSDYARV